MRRRDFVKAGAALAALTGAPRYARADVPPHLWQGYDFGPGPEVADRLNTLVSEEFPTTGMDPGEYDHTFSSIQHRNEAEYVIHSEVRMSIGNQVGAERRIRINYRQLGEPIQAQQLDR